MAAPIIQNGVLNVADKMSCHEFHFITLNYKAGIWLQGVSLTSISLSALIESVHKCILPIIRLPWLNFLQEKIYYVSHTILTSLCLTLYSGRLEYRVLYIQENVLFSKYICLRTNAYKSFLERVIHFLLCYVFIYSRK